MQREQPQHVGLSGTKPLRVPGTARDLRWQTVLGSGTGTERREPERHVSLLQIIAPECVFWTCDKGYLNVPRQLPCGDVLIANVGDPAGNSKGALSPVTPRTRGPGWWLSLRFVTRPLLCGRWVCGAGWTEL